MYTCNRAHVGALLYTYALTLLLVRPYPCPTVVVGRLQMEFLYKSLPLGQSIHDTIQKRERSRVQILSI